MDNLRQIFGIDAKYETWDKKGRLPLYITERYEVQRILLGELWCIALTPIGEMETLPALKKQIRKIQEIENSPVFIRARRLSRFRCQNMIQNRIPFVTEKQIYLPFMGTYLEKMNDQLESLKQLTPSAQQLLLLYFYSETQKMYLSEAGKKLPVTAMTLTRAARQLEDVYKRQEWRRPPFNPNNGALPGRLRSGGGSEPQGTGQGSAAGTRGQ